MWDVLAHCTDTFLAIILFIGHQTPERKLGASVYTYTLPPDYPSSRASRHTEEGRQVEFVYEAFASMPIRAC
jgi:hypothetical protein